MGPTWKIIQGRTLLNSTGSHVTNSTYPQCISVQVRRRKSSDRVNTIFSLSQKFIIATMSATFWSPPVKIIPLASADHVSFTFTRVLLSTTIIHPQRGQSKVCYGFSNCTVTDNHNQCTWCPKQMSHTLILGWSLAQKQTRQDVKMSFWRERM